MSNSNRNSMKNVIGDTISNVNSVVNTIYSDVNEEMVKYIGLAISIIMASMFNVFLIFILLILDNILAYKCLLNKGKSHKWNSKRLYNGIVKKLFIYFCIVLISEIVKRLVEFNQITTIVLGVILTPELKSIDEKIMCLYNKTIFSYIIDKLFINNNINTKSNIQHPEFNKTNNKPKKQQNK